MNNFEKYGNKEELVIKKWIERTEWLKGKVKKVEKNNTPFHDYKIEVEGIGDIIVEIKYEEYYWYEKTGNIGLDFLSAFNFVSEEKKEYYLNKCNNWVGKEDIQKFLNEDIKILKKGKLFTCDADIQLYYCEKKSEDPEFIIAYNNNKLKDSKFIDYLKSTYRLRINNKSCYDIKENWESAAYFINPWNDKNLINCSVNNYNELKESKGVNI